uniref:Uncharacterized protein n=1 Tax=Anguilla anguilla TaxID=7936 RepID=A0A0E9UA54_ANGAN
MYTKATERRSCVHNKLGCYPGFRFKTLE